MIRTGEELLWNFNWTVTKLAGDIGESRRRRKVGIVGNFCTYVFWIVIRNFIEIEFGNFKEL